MAIFHLDVKTGTRGGGQSASAKFDYLGREGRYSKEAEELEYKESGNMPAWAEDDAGKYWAAADEHERVNGRLFQQVEVALPEELNEQQRRDLARSFAEKLTGQERLPYTLAIHRGEAKNPGDKNNPHAHLMISERGLDGHARSAETWFKRANKRNPERGGALKSREPMNPDWIAQTRQVWEQEANRALERAGRSERINHRSLAEQFTEAERSGDLERAAELSREPSVHRGPQTRQADSTVKQRVGEVDRINRGLERERREIDASIGQAEQEITGERARLKETYERIRTAIDERIRQAGRAIRAGSEAAGRAVRELGRAGHALGRAGATIGRAVRTGAERVRRVGEQDDRTRRGPPEDGRTCDEIDRRLRHSDQRLQRSREGFNRAHSLIHAEAEQKRTAGDRWDRFEGRIESLIQSQRERNRSGPEW